MHCPKCGKENPDDAKFCQFCSASTTDTLESKQPVTVKVSKLAIISLICALCGLALTLPALIAITSPRVLSPRAEWVTLTFLISLFILAISLVLGIISIVRIEGSGGKITGRAFALAGVLLPIFTGLLPIWFIISHRPRSVAFRMVCGTNLSQIGKGMLIYANDYNDELPRAGGPNGRWVARLPWWAADNLRDAYGLSDPNATEGRASVSASLYLLVKYADVPPKSFVCNKDRGTTEFKLSDYINDPNVELIDVWDFGPNPPRHCSYAYHMPYGPFHLTSSSPPGLAVAADRNPWQDSPFAKARDFRAFDPNGGRETVKAGNAIAHQGDGQNVLFMDSHVTFEMRSFCGIQDDNIYTYWDGEDKVRGTPPALGSQPADPCDSLLVNDPAIPQ